MPIPTLHRVNRHRLRPMREIRSRNDVWVRKKNRVSISGYDASRRSFREFPQWMSYTRAKLTRRAVRRVNFDAQCHPSPKSAESAFFLKSRCPNGRMVHFVYAKHGAGPLRFYHPKNAKIGAFYDPPYAHLRSKFRRLGQSRVGIQF